MDLGFRRAGVKVVWANDFNASACETYKANFGNEIHCGSMMDFYYKTLPDCDLVFGGPPCQGFSVAGKMDPDDPRSKLVFEFQKVVGAKRPKFFVMENVAALGRLAKFEAVRKRLLDGYRKMGYSVRFEILDSQHYNTQQRRERLIMIGTLCGMDAIQFPKKSRRVVTAREVLAGFDEPGTGNNLGVCDARITTAKSPVLRASPYAGMLFNGMGRPIDLSRPCQTLPASMGGNKTPIIDTRLLINGWPIPWKPEAGMTLYVIVPAINWLLWTAYAMFVVGYREWKAYRNMLLVMGGLIVVYAFLFGVAPIHRGVRRAAVDGGAIGIKGSRIISTAAHVAAEMWIYGKIPA